MSRGLLPIATALAIAAGAWGAAESPWGAGAAASGSGAGTAASGSGAGTAASGSTRGHCEEAVLGAVRTVAHRVYEEIAEGDITRYTVDRLTESPDLVKAVERGDHAGVMKVLKGMEDEFADVEVIRDGHVLGAIQETAGALAPVAEDLRNARGKVVGRLILSAEGDLGYYGIVKTITGARMVMKAGGEQMMGPTDVTPTGNGLVREGGRTYRPVEMTLTAYPSGSLEGSLLVPSGLLYPCMRSGVEPRAAEARAETFGYVAQRIYGEELAGGKTREVVKSLEESPKLRRAVARENREGIRAVILEYFASRLHVVRVRAFKGTKMIYDLGGPHVIAPARGDLRDSAGRIFGHFLVSVQDDEGYRKLLNIFTGAQVVLHMGSELVQSTLPGDSAKLELPRKGLGQVSYRGTSYEVYSFVGRAFPSGRLYISLLIPE